MQRILSHLVLISVISLFVTACATSPESLRSGAAGSAAFSIALPLSEVFSTIRERAISCNPGTRSSNLTILVGAVPVQTTSSITWYVNPIIESDQQKAEIQFFNRNSGIESHMMVVDLSASPSGETRVVTHYKFSAWKEAAENVEAWVKGTSHRCWVKS